MSLKLTVALALKNSEFLILMKSAVGFLKYQHYLSENELTVDWATVGIFVAFGLGGCFAGQYVNSRLNQQTLKKAFAVFLILLGGFIVVREGLEFLHYGPSAFESSGGSLETELDHVD